MRIANTVSDSIVDGPGLRLTIFTQGCLHACPNCHNPHTHDPNAGSVRSLDALCALMDANPLTQGLTLSGGEPFLQAADCAALASQAHARGLNVWVYTGHRFEALLTSGRADWLALLQETDVLVDGLYLEAQRDLLLHFRGSRNQRLIDVPRSLAAGTVQLWAESNPTLSQFTVPAS